MTSYTNEIAAGDLFVGLSGLDMQGTRVEFPRGVVLEQTFAHLMAPMAMAFAPPGPGGYHPAPWKTARGGFGQDITAQLTVPKDAADTLDERIEIASTITFLLRLWSDPSITMIAGANMSFAAISEAPDAAAHIVPFQFRRRVFALSPADTSGVLESLDWVAAHFETTLRLMRGSPEFRLAAYAMDTGQFVENTALTLISLWGALEALFSPSTAELRFRVSALIASYTSPPGSERQDAQKRIAGLYDKRSAAAHGAPKHDGDDLLATFELLRKVLIKFIRDGRVPSKQELEGRLFGVT